MAGYWSSFSFWVMLATRSFRKRSPRTQRWASSVEEHSRSRLFLAPLKITVKHWFSWTDPDSRLSASDWQPSRTQSTSVTATGREKKAKFRFSFNNTTTAKGQACIKLRPWHASAKCDHLNAQIYKWHFSWSLDLQFIIKGPQCHAQRHS